ncbi:hypothetical protein SISNIDRAFT_461041 [Sistotremastrum niveocremeum HHB9708]|uniref:Peptidase C14 caspase domain-containing protein n=1 Tax=Sistotremastrum niveocremeum HHB9708 TaxID=1314777 RepID=A0A164N3I1_9AGAM|nr:hypothetical protein SISNIDRAFT_461041 [Sistotremastrum niveocremeum HHB9708]
MEIVTRRGVVWCRYISAVALCSPALESINVRDIHSMDPHLALSNLSSMSLVRGQTDINPPTGPASPHTGSRKALLIGVKAVGIKELEDLNAPHNDIEVIRNFLKAHGWDETNIITLADMEEWPQDAMPTKRNVVKHLKELAANATASDQLFVFIAGHGDQVPDTDDDEADGYDEAFVTCDGQHIIDDELFNILVQPLPLGCTLTALFDMCHSGTGLDLPYNLPGAYTGLSTSAGNTLSKHAMKLVLEPHPERRKQSDGKVVLWAACSDEEFCQEATIKGREVGILTHTFTSLFDSKEFKTDPSYHNLLTLIRNKLQMHGVEQQVLISSSFDLDLKSTFNL